MHIIALTTFHNRVNKTLKALEDLHAQVLPPNTSISVTVVDDGSSDGTSDEIRKNFPLVEIISGNGNLFWAGGMCYGWEKSIKYKKHYDYLLLFNDDIQLQENALEDLINISISLKKCETLIHTVNAVFLEKETNLISYSGFMHKSKVFPLLLSKAIPQKKPQRIDTINMNLTLIPKETIKEIGFLSNEFIHSMADIDYGLRVNKAGGENWLSGEALGYCEKNIPQPISNNRALLIKKLLSPKSIPFNAWKTLHQRHGGFFWVATMFYPYLKALFFGK